MIEVRDLTKDYGPHRAIHALNFTVKKGDVVGFLGPNGAGKSTTMKIITGFMAPTSGTARIAGFDVFESPLEVKKRIGYLPETPPVYTDMYVRDYLRYVARLKGMEKNRIEKSIDRAVEKTSLGDVQKRLIGHLSKGFRQRVGIAQAIVSDPDVLVLDEPTVGLDPKQMHEIRELIRELRGQHTIILSTHILPEVQATCERAIIINKGRIVAEDSIANLATLEKGRSRLFVRLRREVGDLGAVLSDIDGVMGVESGSSNREWRVNLRGNEDTVDAVSSRLVSQGYGLLEFSPSKVDLEDVFLKLTYGQSRGGEA
ncbi:MAG: ATP-binding cassette domain-containing protein [Bdellovibrionaceae bacterium]|nr:ATP-binding cassette domain-containing protein [Pseudobdellovibrionaceae bacterium]MBX3034487.1 ATP-binding cassette domain-containing protein [Pseudobdellovibrionaceae bacterium]